MQSTMIGLIDEAAGGGRWGVHGVCLQVALNNEKQCLKFLLSKSFPQRGTTPEYLQVNFRSTLNVNLMRCSTSAAAAAAKSLSHVQLFATLWTVAHQAPLSMGFSRQEYWRR